MVKLDLVGDAKRWRPARSWYSDSFEILSTLDHIHLPQKLSSNLQCWLDLTEQLASPPVLSSTMLPETAEYADTTFGMS